jgi:hypothetical protein
MISGWYWVKWNGEKIKAYYDKEHWSIPGYRVMFPDEILEKVEEL